MPSFLSGSGSRPPLSFSLFHNEDWRRRFLPSWKRKDFERNLVQYGFIWKALNVHDYTTVTQGRLKSWKVIDKDLCRAGFPKDNIMLELSYLIYVMTNRWAACQARWLPGNWCKFGKSRLGKTRKRRNTMRQTFVSNGMETIQEKFSWCFFSNVNVITKIQIHIYTNTMNWTLWSSIFLR